MCACDRGWVQVCPTHCNYAIPHCYYVQWSCLSCWLQSLQAIHAKGVAHGDLRSENILVGDGGKVIHAGTPAVRGQGQHPHMAPLHCAVSPNPNHGRHHHQQQQHQKGFPMTMPCSAHEHDRHLCRTTHCLNYSYNDVCAVNSHMLSIHAGLVH